MARAKRPSARPVHLSRETRRRPSPGTRAGAGRDGWASRLARRLLGLHRRFEVDGVRYKELQHTPLEKVLSSRGRGWKKYEARFPSGRGMQITATRDRRYADFMDVPPLRAIRLADQMFRPGSRVLILGSGTGGLARRAAERVGPHGGVVALEHDHESVRYARRRYPFDNVSFERGGLELLSGELDGAFDLVVADEAWLGRADNPPAACAEAWRLTGPGGRLIFIGDAATTWVRETEAFGRHRDHLARLAPPDNAPTLWVVARPRG